MAGGQVHMEDICRAAYDVNKGLQLLEVCFKAWEARNTPIYRDVLYLEVQKPRKFDTF